MTATEANRSYRLSDRFTNDSGTVFLTGIQAMARLPLEQLRADRAAGLNTAAFAAGYPGSPLGGLDSALERAVRESGETSLVLRPSVNEEYAATAVMGSQLAGSRPDARYDGVIGIWYGKAPGVDRASDAIRHAMFAGADPNGGVVLLAGDDPNAKSSTLPSTSAGVLADLHIPVLYPGDPADVMDLGHHAISMSRATGLWVGMKIVANVADGSASVSLDPSRVKPVIPLHEGAPYRHRPDPRLLTPYTLDIEREIVEVRTNLALQYAELNHLNRVVVDSPGAWIGIIYSGITYWEVREALAVIGLDSDEEISGAGIRMLRMGMPIPFNASTIRDFATGLEEVFVIEEKTPNVESRVKDALYNTSHRPRIVGEYDEFDRRLIKSYGALHADDLVAPLRSRLARLADRLTPDPQVRERIPLAVNRTPYFCSGCPHNRSTVTEPGTAVGAGIGCHTMILLGGRVALRRCHRAHMHGKRGHPVDRHGTLRGNPPSHPEHGRRHVFPLWSTCDDCGHRLRGEHHIQVVVERGRRHDRRAGSHWRHPPQPGVRFAVGTGSCTNHHRLRRSWPHSPTRAPLRGFGAKPR